MRNILLTIEYDGTDFCGWQRQPDKRSVQGELERALTTICGTEIQLNGTSRTDAGVHAYGQRATFSGEFGIPTEKIVYAANNSLYGGMNSQTVGDVRILSAEEVDPEFHARFNSVGKKYVYKIRNCEEDDIFKRNYFYQVRRPLDITKMKEAAKFIVGSHDFACFQSAGSDWKKSTQRTVHKLDVKCREYLENDKFCRDVEIEIVGDGFLYNMVRIITGTLVDVGTGKIHPVAVPHIIESKDRQNAGHTAPPQGLYLVEVYFDEDTMLANAR